MRNFFDVLIFAVIAIIIIVLVIVGLGFGLSYITQWISCEFLLYIETGILFVLALIIGYISKND